MGKRILLTVSNELYEELSSRAEQEYKRLQDVIIDIISGYVATNQESGFEDAFAR